MTIPVLDTALAVDFEDITRLAALVCGASLSAVFLADSGRPLRQICFGLDAAGPESAFSAQTLLQTDLLIIPDAQIDARFADDPWVRGEPHIRFCAGMPLISSEGHALGSLCVFDPALRSLTAQQEAALRLLARQVIRLAEWASREREANFLRIIGALPMPSLLSDDHQNIMFLNDAFVRFLGYRLEDIPTLADWWLRACPDPSCRHQVMTNWQVRLEEATARGTAFAALEMTLRCRDGGERTVMASAATVEEAFHGAHLITFFDITELKRIEEVLRESKQFIESIAEQATNIIFVLDLNTQATVYSNRNVGEILGYSPRQIEAMGDKLLEQMIHPEDLDRVRTHFAQFTDKADGEVVEIEYRARHADCEWRWLWNREVVFKRHSDGAPSQILGTASDITDRKQAHEEAARLGAIVEYSHDAIFAMTLEGTLVSWNAAAAELYGYAESEIIGQHASVLVPATDRGFIADNTAAVLRGEGREKVMVRHQRKNGDWVNVSFIFSPIRNIAGEIIGVGVIVRDISAQKQAEATLLSSKEALRAVMHGAPIVLYATDIHGIVRVWEGAELERLGFASGKAVGRSVFDLYPNDRRIADYHHRGLAGEAVSYDTEMNGHCYHNELTPQRNRDGAIIGMIGVGQDITERKQAEEKLKDFAVVLEFQNNELEKANAELASLASMDGLTGLRNRRAFDARLQEEIERATRYNKPLSLLLLDIDFFKQYNDSFGHLAGDELLRKIGRVLKQAMRETDFVARYGGEEIALILPETERAGAMQLAERVRLAVASAVWEHREVTASLGVSTLRLDMKLPEEMIACADRGLYHSKSAGRNRVTHGDDVSPENADEPALSAHGTVYAR